MAFKGIRGNDRVSYRDRFGDVKSGKANPLLIFPGHVVINVGGKYGTPVVVNDSNYVSHKSAGAARDKRDPDILNVIFGGA